MTNIENTRLIPLTQGKFAIVDAEDYDWLSKYTWRFINTSKTGYASGYFGYHNGKPIEIKMHRLIMSVRPGLEVDHINGNGLDNRRCNLREYTRRQNGINIKKIQNVSSKYKGVSYRKKTNRWRSQIRYDGLIITLGTYINEIDAARAYNVAAMKYHKEFAVLNDI